MTQYNNRIEVDFTDKKGQRHRDVYGIKEQACAYARLLSELGYHIHEVTDKYAQKPVKWRKTDV